MQTNTDLQEIIKLNEQHPDRYEFHRKAAPILEKMGRDPAFWRAVIEQNLSDRGWLNRKWTMYEIPFLYVFENSDFYIKVHLFVPLKDKRGGVAASAIHHHNNYLLTSFAAFGPGYETMLFHKKIEIDPLSKVTRLSIREQFSQKERPVHLVDSWEPHVVINPVELSATLVLWSPDKKRSTDALRTNPVLKWMKRPLRRLIHLLKLDRKMGIAAEKTYQFFTHHGKFHAMEEDEFFAPTRAQAGPEVDDYSIQTVFAFIQRSGYYDKEFLRSMKSNRDLPAYFQKWIDMVLSGQPIADTFAKESINTPSGIMTREQIVAASSLRTT